MEEMIKGYVNALSGRLREEYCIDESHYNSNIKRGLRNSDGTGIIAGISRIGSVSGYYVEDGERIAHPGALYYRGISVEDIVKAHRNNSTFGYEEVAYLLLCGHLPNANEAKLFSDALTAAKDLPSGFFEDVIFKSPGENIMNGLGRCILALYTYDDNADDTSLENMLVQSVKLIARFPTIVADLYAVKRHHFENRSLYIHNPKDGLSVSENFLRLLRRDKAYTDEEAKLLDTLLILHAEHGAGNNSTFTCRSVASTGSDTYSSIAAAVSSLKGPLHGGANAAVMNMIYDIRANVKNIRDDDEVGAYLDKILDKKANDGSGKLYGIGHAVYTMSDPRCVMIKKQICEVVGDGEMPDEYEIAERVERLGIPKLMAKKNMKLPICANVDLYSGIVYSMLGIPEDLYTPLFAIARISGWCAHRIEERISGGRIIRPAYRSDIKHRGYTAIEARK